ncbi:hypothetical protein BPS26883_03217 [Burkholderia pseudomultivorans]|uniref:GtrA/DPMS transmembrane domain-containing protein n=1 Tax=Burkholderia pseudomultivorans TaxID=1207504 RepID=A0A6P2LHV9_9BURK|nr:GtrA family protein [Burkholderia pseudomultivorans]VWB67976.1 hypothetical protein BPS26883_03217 [Burkholderia pseudomultivorans]
MIGPETRRFVRYASVGAIGTAMQYGTTAMLVSLRACDVVVASCTGAIAGAGVNYLLNYHVTFRAVGSHCATALRFFPVAALGIAVNGVLMWLLSYRGRWPWLAAQCMSTGVVLVTTYTANSLWTFRIRRR